MHVSSVFEFATTDWRARRFDTNTRGKRFSGSVSLDPAALTIVICEGWPLFRMIPHCSDETSD